MKELYAVDMVFSPILNLLDSNIPRINGFDFVDLLEKSPLSNQIGVVVVSLSISYQNRSMAMGLPKYIRDFVFNS